jgi:short subunit dehydrogenase-like uncharacterized protein
MREYDVIIYGSYGYTGTLITEEFSATNFRILLSGRNVTKLREQSNVTGYVFEACDVNDQASLELLLRKGKLVINCAGPFQHTAKQMVDACLETSTHYIDITGEYAVFEMLADYDSFARTKGILIMAGAGFDVVPSDCLAVHLKNRLPGATHLQLGFTMSKGGLSRGTARTTVESLGSGGMIRKNGKLTPISLGDKVIEINYGDFKRRSLCIPWGDISTAWRSTGIPNIEVYSGVPDSTIRAAKMSRWINWLLRKSWIKTYLRKKVDARPAGPDAEKRNTGKSYLWGRAYDENGNNVEARMKTLSGYLLTAKTATLIASKLVAADVRSGYFTPAQYFGEGLIFEVEGSSWMKTNYSP